MLIQPANALKLTRHIGTDYRYPGHRDVKGLRHPWLLGSCRAVLPGPLRASANPLPADWSGDPYRNDESLYCSQNRPKSLHRRTLLLIQPVNAFKLSRHTGRECRYPGHMDVKVQRHPWHLDSCRAVLSGPLRASANPFPADWPGDPCRNDNGLHCLQNQPKAFAGEL
jgi:hypothetical protein